MTIEEPLSSSLNAARGVVRVGDTVRSPAGESSSAIRALLLHLEAVGFAGAPRHLGHDEQGRDVLTFIDGSVPLPPYPAWSMTDSALIELAHLLRQLHTATATFDLEAVSGWSTEWADPLGGPVICHNDLFPENVVFRDGRVAALIDFDEVAPGRPFWDVAIAAHEWAPLKAPAPGRDHRPELDGVVRLGLFSRAYGVRPDQAEELLSIIFAEREQSTARIRSEIAAGDPVWADHWRESGGDEQAAADDAWLQANRDALVAAVAGRRLDCY